MLKPLFDAFESEIKTHDAFDGFHFLTSYRAFRRRLQDQIHSVHFSYIKHSHEENFDVTCDVAVRFESVEEILNRNRNHLSKAEKNRTFTIGAELGNLQRSGQIRWTVASERDAEIAALGLAKSVKAIGLPFFDRYTDLIEVAAALATPDMARLICPINSEETLAVFNELGYEVT